MYTDEISKKEKNHITTLLNASLKGGNHLVIRAADGSGMISHVCRHMQENDIPYDLILPHETGNKERIETWCKDHRNKPNAIICGGINANPDAPRIFGFMQVMNKKSKTKIICIWSSASTAGPLTTPKKNTDVIW